MNTTNPLQKLRTGSAMRKIQGQDFGFQISREGKGFSRGRPRNGNAALQRIRASHPSGLMYMSTKSWSVITFVASASLRWGCCWGDPAIRASNFLPAKAVPH